MAYTQQLFDSLRRPGRGGGGALGEPALDASALATPARSRLPSATPASSSAAGDDPYGVIALQKSQLAQLRSRVEALEDTVSQVRARSLRWAGALPFPSHACPLTHPLKLPSSGSAQPPPRRR